MLGFHAISAAAISALKKRVVSARRIGGVALWLLNKKKKWSVETPLGDKYFETEKEALEYYIHLIEGEKPSRKVKKIRKLGKVSLAYVGKPIENIEVKGVRGVEILRDSALTEELQRLIEIALILQIEEEEDLMLLAVALTA